MLVWTGIFVLNCGIMNKVYGHMDSHFFSTNHAVFVAVGCFLVAVFGCVSTHLKNEKEECKGGWCTSFYCFERTFVSVPIWDNIFSLIRSKGH